MYLIFTILFGTKYGLYSRAEIKIISWILTILSCQVLESIKSIVKSKKIDSFTLKIFKIVIHDF